MASFVNDTNYGFGALDFGFENDDEDTWRGYLIDVPQCGTYQQVRSSFRFPGVDGEWSQDLGQAAKLDEWILFILGTTNTDLVTFEAAVEAVKNDGISHAYSVRGRNYDRAIIEEFQAIGPRRGQVGSFTTGQMYRIVFRVLP